MTVERFRQAAARWSSGIGTGKRYPARLREFAVSYARREQGRGRAVSAVAKQLGVPAQTLSYWLGHAAKPKASSVVAVRVRPSSRPSDGADVVSKPPSSVVVMTPEGYRIAVGHVDEAAALVRALR